MSNLKNLTRLTYLDLQPGRTVLELQMLAFDKLIMKKFTIEDVSITGLVTVRYDDGRSTNRSPEYMGCPVNGVFPNNNRCFAASIGAEVVLQKLVEEQGSIAWLMYLGCIGPFTVEGVWTDNEFGSNFGRDNQFQGEFDTLKEAIEYARAARDECGGALILDANGKQIPCPRD